MQKSRYDGLMKTNRLMIESITDCSMIQLDNGGRVMSWNAGAQRIKVTLQKKLLVKFLPILY